MNYKMVVDSELLKLSIPQRFIVYSNAFCNGALALTGQMIADDKLASWANAAVVLMLSTHSAELLLKAMLFNKNPDAKLSNTHDLDKLYKMYQTEFNEKKFKLDMSFKNDYLGMSDAEIVLFKSDLKLPAPSILYRYPTKSGNAEWEGACGFKANSYMPIISALSSDIKRLKEYIA